MNEFRIYDTKKKTYVENEDDFCINPRGQLCLTFVSVGEDGEIRALLKEIEQDEPGRYRVERLFLDNPEICKTHMYHKDRVLVKLPDEPLEEGRTFEGVIEFDEFDCRFYVDEYRNG